MATCGCWATSATQTSTLYTAHHGVCGLQHTMHIDKQAPRWSIYSQSGPRLAGLLGQLDPKVRGFWQTTSGSDLILSLKCVEVVALEAKPSKRPEMSQIVEKGRRHFATTAGAAYSLYVLT
ncbi:hypothetical protein J6590_005499 [Homalodisca vitripennis]|nr:hypothetical protein J6590_005499 [Homalodisca vitripennis]